MSDDIEPTGNSYGFYDEKPKPRDELTALRERVAELERALKFYADEDLYAPLEFVRGPGTKPILAVDRGRRARAALAKAQGE